MAVTVAYPPLDIPKPVAPDVWIVDSGPMRAAGVVPLPLRMTVLRLPDGGLLLHSPTRHTPALQEALASLGRIAHLVLPSFAHWMFALGWQQAVPVATTWAAPGMAARGPIRTSGLRLDAVLGALAPAAWAGTIEHVLVPGALGFWEVALFHRPSRTLVLTDLVQNLEADKLPLAARLLLTAAGAVGTERPPLYLRALVRMGGAEARAAGQRLVVLQPERVVFAHGAWFAQDAAGRLARSLGWLAG